MTTHRRIQLLTHTPNTHSHKSLRSFTRMLLKHMYNTHHICTIPIPHISIQDDVYYMPVQGSKWVCRCVRAENVDHHIKHQCPLFPVMCSQGCGQRMERRLVGSQGLNICHMHMYGVAVVRFGSQ